MPYLRETRARKASGQLAGHARQHAHRVAMSATDRYRHLLSPDREVLDLREFQRYLGEELARMELEISEHEDRHADQLQRDRDLRDVRDLKWREVVDGLLQLKKTVEGYAGPGANQKIFKENPILPDDPVALYALTRRVHNTLTAPGFALEGLQQGVVVSPRVLVKNFEGPMIALGEAIDELRDSESLTRHTQSLKDAALERIERFVGQVARFFEAFYHLSGHDRLAGRLRRSSHIRALASADDGSEPESDGADPANESEGDPAADPAPDPGAVNALPEVFQQTAAT